MFIYLKLLLQMGFFFLICDHVLSIIYMVLCKQVSLEK